MPTRAALSTYGGPTPLPWSDAARPRLPRRSRRARVIGMSSGVPREEVPEGDAAPHQRLHLLDALRRVITTPQRSPRQPAMEEAEVMDARRISRADHHGWAGVVAPLVAQNDFDLRRQHVAPFPCPRPPLVPTTTMLGMIALVARGRRQILEHLLGRSSFPGWRDALALVARRNLAPRGACARCRDSTRRGAGSGRTPATRAARAYDVPPRRADIPHPRATRARRLVRASSRR